MTKHKRASQLKVKFNTKEDIDEDIDEEIEDDSDDDDYNPKHEAKKKKTTIELQDDPIVNAMQKCHKIVMDIQNALNITSTMAMKNPTQSAKEDKKFVLKADVDASCDILKNDAIREIKPYQIGGINFLLLLHRLHIGGAILADEMGLGKTIQVIAFLAVLKRIDGNPGPHLVVAPVSILENWKQEMTRWCPSFNTIVYHGKSKENVRGEFSHMNEKGESTPFNILITSYSIFEGKSLQMKEDRKFLKMWNWNCVIMDEGHVLKDATSLRSKRLQSIVCNAKQRIMLTGTPIQNDLQELWSLLSFMMPDTFNAYGKNLQELLGARNHGIHDQSLIAKMQALLKPFVMRRTKSEVLSQLQFKSHFVLKVDMVYTQAQAYNEALLYWREFATSKCTVEENDILNIDNLKYNQRIANALTSQDVTHFFTHLRKIGNHPLLVRRIYTNEVVKMLAERFYKLGVFGNQCIEKQVYDRLLSCSDFDLHKLCEEYGGIPNGQGKLNNELAFSSAKCQELAKLLPELKKEGHRCLVFSQWRMILDILEWALSVLGYKFIRLDGSTNVATRQALVDEYNHNQDIFIFLISTRAGGQGLNLIGADTVIIHDVDFNPQIDRQAEDRCHRIGQLKPVTIYRLVTKNSVDESIYNIAQKKLNLDEAVLHKRHHSTKDELQLMGQILVEQIHHKINKN